jgi:hypothetical protein
MSGRARGLVLAVVSALLAGPAAAAPSYPWLEPASVEATRSLEEAQPAPDGWTRTPVGPGTLGEWLRGLPVRTDATVRAYDGRVLRAPAAHVVEIDVGDRDLQQCADTTIRLLSEYAWASGRASELGWHFTSGDLTTWADWVAGERFAIGRTVERSRGAPRPADRATFRGWLDLVFTYAGTRSLAREGTPVGDRPVEAGDVFVSPGSPGHAVIVLDVAVGPDGRRAGLLGQGFMPAQDLHVLRRDLPGESAVLDGVWFVLPGPGERLDTPSWDPFAAGDARRLVSPPTP